MCCETRCYRCSTDNDNNRRCNPCGRRSSWCNVNCYCSDNNHQPKCQIIRGTCYTPIVTVQFTDISGRFIVTNASTECDIGDLSCATNFIGNNRVGFQTRIEYEIANPNVVYLHSPPDYRTSASIITAIVFGSLFIVIAFVACIIMCLNIPEGLCYCPVDCNCCSKKYNIESPSFGDHNVDNPIPNTTNINSQSKPQIRSFQI